jgi:acyl-CoA reductase-like NAD-dependent aldehyde dehydrogenase
MSVTHWPHVDDDDAVRIVNDSLYVLSASLERAMKVARRVRTGRMNVNGALILAPNAAFEGASNQASTANRPLTIRGVSGERRRLLWPLPIQHDGKH